MQLTKAAYEHPRRPGTRQEHRRISIKAVQTPVKEKPSGEEARASQSGGGSDTERGGYAWGNKRAGIRDRFAVGFSFVFNADSTDTPPPTTHINTQKNNFL